MFLKQFFKRKVPAWEVGAALTRIVWGSEEGNAVDMRVLEGTTVDRQMAWNQMVILRVLTVDFTVAMLLEGQEKKSVLDSYYAHLVPELADGWQTWEALQPSLRLYTEAVKIAPKDIPRSVGQAFAKLCGEPISIDIMYRGSLIFTGYYKQVSMFINSFTIVL